MAIKIAIFNSKSAWNPDKQLTTMKWQGFSAEVNPQMKQNLEDGIVFRLAFDTPEPDNQYAVICIVEDVASGKMRFGRVVTRHTDYLDISGGHVNGGQRNLVFTVLVIT